MDTNRAHRSDQNCVAYLTAHAHSPISVYHFSNGPSSKTSLRIERRRARVGSNRVYRWLAALLVVTLFSANTANIEAFAGPTVTATLVLEGTSTQTSNRDGSCGATDFLGNTSLFVGDAKFSLRDGTPVDKKTSPSGRFGCQFKLTGKVTAASTYEVRIGDTVIGTITSDELAALDNHIEIAITSRAENRANGWRFPEKPTPTPKPTKTAVPTKAPTPTPKAAPTLGAIPGSDTYMLGGTFKLYGSSGDEFSIYDGMCFGNGGYGDIGVGAKVVIKDQTGSIVAVGELEPDPNASSFECRFVFYVEVPDAKFYSVEISHRGELVYSKAELEEQGWLVELALG